MNNMKGLAASRGRNFLLVIYILSLACVSSTQQVEKSPNELFRIKRDGDGKWGYIDRTGKVIIAPQFDFARDFSEGLALVGKDGKHYFINDEGEIVIDSHEKIGNPAYEFLGDFAKGIAFVKVEGDLGNDRGYIDKMGKLVIRLKVEPTGNVTAVSPVNSVSRSLVRDVSGEQYLSIKVNGKYGYYDTKGKEIIRPQFDKASGFSEGLAIVKLNGKCGYIDKTGQITIPLQFDYVDDFSEGLAVVGIGDKYGYIDRTGSTVIKLQYDRGLRFFEGLAPVKKGEKTGYINHNGTMIITPQFDLAGEFSDGLAPVRVNNLWGYIDKAGNIVIEPRFDDAGSFSKGIALIEIDNKIGYINKECLFGWSA
ncbi:MAG: WG repeat-containing protein [Nitrososphaerales archaeon]